MRDKMNDLIFVIVIQGLIIQTKINKLWSLEFHTDELLIYTTYNVENQVGYSTCQPKLVSASA